VAHGGVVALWDCEGRLVAGAMNLAADERLQAFVDARRRARRRLLDPQLGQARLDRLGHAADVLDLADVAERAARELAGQALDVERTAPRIDDARGAGLPLQHDLGPAHK